MQVWAPRERRRFQRARVGVKPGRHEAAVVDDTIDASEMHECGEIRGS
jgi:hypothetical protein